MYWQGEQIGERLSRIVSTGHWSSESERICRKGNGNDKERSKGYVESGCIANGKRRVAKVCQAGQRTSHQKEPMLPPGLSIVLQERTVVAYDDLVAPRLEPSSPSLYCDCASLSSSGRG